MTLLMLTSAAALACAGLFHDPDSLAESEAQEAILEIDGANTTVSYNVQYWGDAEDFGWIIPVFGEFVSLEDGDVERFTALHDATRPTVIYEYEDETSGGCLGGAKYDNLSGRGDTGDWDSQGVDVIDQGFTGTYSYVVIEGTSATAVTDWLDTNGWYVGESGPAIDSYVAEGGVQFAAIRLVQTIGGGDTDGQLLPPVVLTYEGSTLRFPALMARYASVPDLRTTLFAVGDERASMGGGWTAAEVGTVEADLSADASELFEGAIRELGGDSPGYAVVFSGQVAGEGWVTRFDTSAMKEVHVVDPVLAFDGGQDEATTVIRLTEGYEAGMAHPAWSLLALLGLAVTAIRRRD